MYTLYSPAGTAVSIQNKIEMSTEQFNTVSVTTCLNLA